MLMRVGDLLLHKKPPHFSGSKRQPFIQLTFLSTVRIDSSSAGFTGRVLLVDEGTLLLGVSWLCAEVTETGPSAPKDWRSRFYLLMRGSCKKLWSFLQSAMGLSTI